MRTRSLACALFTLLLLVLGSLTRGQQVPSTSATKARVAASYGKLPLTFEVNQGQADDQVKFVSRRPGFSLFLTPAGAVLSFSKQLQAATPETVPGVRLIPPREVLTDALYVKLAGANATPSVEGLNQLVTKSNYFIGGDPKKWKTNVPNYAKVKYVSVYPGVDLVYYGNELALEHDFIVSPGADPRVITLEFDKKEKITIDREGDLVVKRNIGEVRFQEPVVYQEVGGVRQQVAGRYMRKGKNRIGFRVGQYDLTKTLVIDPTLSYSTYDNKNGYNDIATTIAVDSAGYAYVAGVTGSSNFPVTTGAFKTTYPGGTDSFVMKLNATGSAVIYATYLGGSGGASADGIALDSSGNAYVTGIADSSDFPITPGAFQATFYGAIDPFVTKLDATGSNLIYSTFLSGPGGLGFYNHGTAIAVDSADSAYVVGQTSTNTFPTTPGAFETTVSGLYACFVMKFNASGSLSYSTFLGATTYQATCNAIAVDSVGSAYVTGQTLAVINSGLFPTTQGAFQQAVSPLPASTFVTKLNPTGTGLVYSTLVSGGNDMGTGIAVDSSGSAYVTGWATSSTFPTTQSAFQTTFSGTPGATKDAFITKLTPDGSGLVYSTYLGSSVTYSENGTTGSVGTSPWIVVDSTGSACVIGTTSSKSFPITSDAFQSTYSAQYSNAFVTKLSADGSGLVYSTYLGGPGQDLGLGIAVDPNGSLYVAGLANDINFPTTAGAFQPTSVPYGGGFVAKFGFDQPGVLLSPNPLTFPSTMVGQSSAVQTVTFSASGSGALAFSKIALTGTNAGDYALSSNTCGQTLAANNSCSVQVTFTPTGAGARSATLQFTDDVYGSPQTVSLSGTGLSQASTTTTLTSSLNPAFLGQSVTFTATVTLTGAGTPAGTVAFYDGATSLGSSPLSGTQATFSTSVLSVGPHSITAIYSGDTNFTSSTSAAVTETINKATPTITWSAPVAITYGTPLSATQLNAVANVAGTFTYSPASGAVLNAGSQTLTVTFTPSDGTDYSTSTANVFLSVNPAPLTITASSGSMVYGGSVLSVTPSYAGFVNGDTAASLTTAPMCSTTATSTSSVGTYASSCSGAVSPNYTLTYVAGTVTVTPASTTTSESVVPSSVTYGNVSSVTISVSSPVGTVPGNVTLSVDGGTTSTMSLTNGSASFSLGILVAGNHTLAASFAAQGNFQASSAQATLVVNQAPATVTANAASKTYGSADPTLTATETGFISTDAATITLSATRAPGESAGTYVITPSASGAALANYNVTYTAATFTISKAGATVTATAASKTYGTSDPPLTDTESGFTAADAATITLSATRAPGESVGTYVITPSASGAALANYNVTYTPATFTINKASATVTATAASKTYGTTDPALTATESGFSATDAVTITLSATRAPGESVGTYTITPSATGAALANYSVTYTVAVFSISKATATVTATAATKTYGTADPTLTATETGFTAADAATIVLSATRTAGENVGTYTITPFATGAALTNYSLTYTPATFTINKASATVTLSNLTQTYTGVALTPTATTVPSGLAITLAGAPDTNVGSYAVTATVSNPNYAGSASGTFVINSVMLTITANNATRVFGVANPTFTWTATGFVNRENVSVFTANPSCTTTATISSPIGTYPITCSGATAQNYSFKYVSGTLTITSNGTGALSMGFWKNPNGQMLINNYCNPSSGTSLMNFLTGFDPFKDDTVTTCAGQATYVSGIINAATCSGSTCNAMLRAQMLATALDIYFSTPGLGGNHIGAYNGLGASTPALGGVAVDLSSICSMVDGSSSSTCSGTFEDARSEFGITTSYKSTTVLQLLSYSNYASLTNGNPVASSNVGQVWYIQNKMRQTIAKDVFDNVNNDIAKIAAPGSTANPSF